MIFFIIILDYVKNEEEFSIEGGLVRHRDILALRASISSHFASEAANFVES